ncbi:MAG: hypothetical protein ABR535_02840, partial [Pyrinomonadaceae bacterium]
MHISNLRKPAAFFLLFAIWNAAIGLAPITVAGQAKDEKKQASKKQNDEVKSQAQTQPSAKTLSVKEDPAQIGKRKINSGSDKLFGWLGGSQEKEVAVGRQLALEVEQQAKLVEDPIV